MTLKTEHEFDIHKGEVTCKYINYFQIYDYIFLKALSRRINNKNPIHILELGILKGGSLQIWNKLFKNSKISGLDLKKSINYKNIDCFKGSQTDKNIFESITHKNGLIDIMIDDASHIAGFSLKSFSNFLKNCNDFYGYICEDIHTHFDTNRDGFEIKDTINFLELIKNISLKFAEKNSSIILSNQIVGYFARRNQKLLKNLQEDKSVNNKYFNELNFIYCSDIIKNLFKENKNIGQIIINNFDKFNNSDDLFVFLYLLSQRISIKEYYPYFLPDKLKNEILKFPFFVKNIVVENKNLIINYTEKLDDPLFYKSKNYGSKRKLFLFECEARLKNNLIKLFKFIKTI